MRIRRRETQSEIVARTSKWHTVFVVWPVLIDDYWYFWQKLERKARWATFPDPDFQFKGYCYRIPINPPLPPTPAPRKIGRWHIHWMRFHHRSDVNIYTQCRCGKRGWYPLEAGYSVPENDWLEGYDNEKKQEQG